jgi:signal transduction histidine kinase/ActR/RegA family two-component response regulator
LFGDSAELRRAAANDRRVMESGEPLVVEEVRQARGGPRTYQMTKSPLRDPQGQIFGIVGVARDITALKETQQTLESLLAAEHRLRADAERANRAKDEFLAIVSHELRSPLNALKGWSQILAGARDDDAALVGRAAEAIRRNVDHQTRLIDDLLDTARIISGKLDLDLQRIDIIDVVDSAVANARELALSKRIDLRFAADADEVMVDGDFDRLQQVLNNLLSNAIKFTPEGGRIEIGLSHLPDRVELSVTDNGIGIEADFLPHVFDRFSQADTSLTRRYFGLGIGLALVRNLVELHGGSVGVVSAGAGQGACFTVILPRAQPRTMGRNGGKAEPATAKALDGTTIVIVDDDPDAREVLQMMLSRAGARVQSFDAGAKLLGAWRTALLVPEPDVLLLDIAMPGDSGFEILRQLRALESGSRVPAIAVTALAQLDERRFAEAGFDGRVGKPVDERNLIETIVAVLAAERRRAARGDEMNDIGL